MPRFCLSIVNREKIKPSFTIIITPLRFRQEERKTKKERKEGRKRERNKGRNKKERKSTFRKLLQSFVDILRTRKISSHWCTHLQRRSNKETLPSCLSSHNVNKRLSLGLFSATSFFLHFYAFLLWFCC